MTILFTNRALLVLGFIGVISGNLGGMNNDNAQNQCTALIPYQDPNEIIENSIECHRSALMRNALAEAYSSKGLANQHVEEYKNRLDEARSVAFQNIDYFEKFTAALIDDIDISNPSSFFHNIQTIMALGSTNKPCRDVFKQSINGKVGLQKQSVNTLLFTMKKLGINERDLLEAFDLNEDDISYIEERLLVVESGLIYTNFGWVRHGRILHFLDVICVLAKIYSSNLERTIEIFRSDSHDFFLLCRSLPSFARLIDKNIQEKINSTHSETLRRYLENRNLLTRICEEECYELVPSLLLSFRKMYHNRPDLFFHWRRELTQVGREEQTPLRLICYSGNDEITQLLINDLKQVYVNDLASLQQALNDALDEAGEQVVIDVLEEEISLLAGLLNNRESFDFY